MKRVIGYAISIAGLAVMTIGFGMVNVGWKILETIKPSYISSVGIIAIIVGVVIALQSKSRSRKKIDKGEKEVPIYEGVGKNRKIVGYRKD
ncbi:MAG: hypothetical protein OEL87_01460 [Nanoarchaeota archaeon]|nr:hypothetical protein [Nanoarchaeota archaeon]